MSTGSQISQTAALNVRRVPGELSVRGLVGMIILFLAIDGLVYGVGAKMFRRYQAAAAARSDDRLKTLGDRVDALERQLQSLNGDVSKAATTATAAAKQSEAAIEGVRELQGRRGGSRPRPQQDK